MKELLNKLVKSMEDKKNDVNETTLINSFKVLLEKLPKFYIENLDIKVINNSYGKIIANIRTKSGAANADSWTDIIAERQRKREEAAKSGQGVEDLFEVRGQFATIISLRAENPALAETFIVSNFEYIFQFGN